jgi:RNA polymerase sigma factor (sigma-70 family)
MTRGDDARDAAGDDPESELLEAVRRGDRHAYVTLYERHVAAARSLARGLLRNQADADDVVSEVFVSMLSVIAAGKGPRDGFRSYLMDSVRNECYRSGRRRGRYIPVATASDTPARSTERAVDPFAERDEVDLLQQAFQSLPPTFREVRPRRQRGPRRGCARDGRCACGDRPDR